MQSQPVVANVVRRAGASRTRTVQIIPKYYPSFGGFMAFHPRLEESWRSGPLTIEGFVVGRSDKTGDSGQGRLVRRHASGAVLEQGPFGADADNDGINASVAGEYRGDHAAYRLNGSVSRGDQDRLETASLRDAAGASFTEQSRTKTRNDRAEIGGDYERTLDDDLVFRLLGLKTFKRDKQKGVLANRGPAQQYGEVVDSGETILRSTVTYAPSPRFQFEAGGEGALNYLDAESSLAVGGKPVALPSANVRVDEKRGEAFATLTTRFEDLSLETAVRYERSLIEQTGGANQKQVFEFIKPRLFATYTAGLKTWRGRIERVVGQLRFRDFAATAQLNAGTVNVGNPDLSPESAWVFEATMEQRFWGSGALVLTVRHDEVTDVVDLIPIDNRFDAPGNIGDGSRSELRTSLTLPLDRIGLNGTVIRANANFRRSSVTDPVTGQQRRISGMRHYEADIQLSKALPGLRSTFYVEAARGWGNFRETYYRINEIRVEQEEPVFNLIWDWTPRSTTSFQFKAENVLGKDRARARTLFDGSRSLGVIASTERRNARLGPSFIVRLRQRI